MPDAFRWVSGLVELSAPKRTFETRLLREPSACDVPFTRVLYHEIVHYWQLLACGYLARMAAEDWERLRSYEATGQSSGAGPLRRHYVRRDAELGFSPLDLVEALARYWEVHVIGPHRVFELDVENPLRLIDPKRVRQYDKAKAEGRIVHPETGAYSSLAFDMAMECSAGNYAAPYLHVRAKNDAVFTAALFPLVAYFALQSRDPVPVFARTIELLVIAVGDELPRGALIHDAWRACFSLARDFTNRASETLTGGRLEPGGAVLQAESMQSHPVYRWLFTELELAAANLVGTELAAEITKGLVDAPPKIRGIMTLDFFLSCPGDPTHRGFLLSWLAPPAVLFSDEGRWCLSNEFRRELVPQVSPEEESLARSRDKASSDAVAVQNRWERFLQKRRGY